ncbi:MAG: L,D-transpeptidase [Gammaproteobacteria bacterium]
MHKKTNLCIALTTCFLMFTSINLYAVTYVNEDGEPIDMSEKFINDSFSERSYAPVEVKKSSRSNRELYRAPREIREISGAGDYSSRLPEKISAPGEKLVVVDPHVHAWGAYTADGRLLRAGLVTAGAKWCSDIGRPCRTKIGEFRIRSLGGNECVSTLYPIDVGGAPMPYCMFFNGNQALHGSYHVTEGNVSHGCVRVSVADAEWLRYQFVRINTKIIIKPY